MSLKGNPGMSLEDLKREALKLPHDDRDELVRTLCESLDEEEEEAGSRLPAEVRRRYEAYKEVKTKPISFEELFAELD
jgi:putative addiction module component (TIGR02574 family)